MAKLKAKTVKVRVRVILWIGIMMAGIELV